MIRGPDGIIFSDKSTRLVRSVVTTELAGPFKQDILIQNDAIFRNHAE